ncbi:MAG: hypothetical protein ACPIOQ_09670, partial [Promethearchaeia archaeon]
SLSLFDTEHMHMDATHTLQYRGSVVVGVTLHEGVKTRKGGPRVLPQKCMSLLPSLSLVLAVLARMQLTFANFSSAERRWRKESNI